MISGFQIVYLNKWKSFFIEVFGTDITDIFYRSKRNGSQEIFSTLVDALMANKEIEYQELKQLTLENAHYHDFGFEFGENHLQKFVKIYDKKEMELSENLQVIDDCKMLFNRFGMDFDLERERELDGFPIRDLVKDRVAILDRSIDNTLEYHFFDGENIIAKSFGIDSSVTCLDDSIHHGRILGFIQFCIHDEAMDLSEINNEILKMFVTKNLKQICLPYERFLMRNGTTKFNALPDDKIAEMTKDLQRALILDQYTEIQKGYLIFPVWKTKAIDDELVHFEIGFRLHIGPSKKIDEDFRFFI